MNQLKNFILQWKLKNVKDVIEDILDECHINLSIDAKVANNAIIEVLIYRMY